MLKNSKLPSNFFQFNCIELLIYVRTLLNYHQYGNKSCKMF